MNRWITQSLSILAMLTLSSTALAAGNMPPQSFEEALPKLAFHALNITILVGLLFWLAGGKIKDALNNRATGIRVELDSAAQAKAEAQERFDALQSRLDSLDSQIKEMRVEAEAAAEQEREAIAARAERDAKLLRENAQRSIRDEVARARAELRREAVGLAVELAGEQLRAQITTERQAGLTSQFLNTVQNSNGADNG